MKKGKLNTKLIEKLSLNFLKDKGENKCFYCNSNTECKEHVVPASYFGVRKIQGWKR